MGVYLISLTEWSLCLVYRHAAGEDKIQNHRFIEYPELERAHKDHQVQLLVLCRTSKSHFIFGNHFLHTTRQPVCKLVNLYLFRFHFVPPQIFLLNYLESTFTTYKKRSCGNMLLGFLAQKMVPRSGKGCILNFKISCIYFFYCWDMYE